MHTKLRKYRLSRHRFHTCQRRSSVHGAISARPEVCLCTRLWEQSTHLVVLETSRVFHKHRAPGAYLQGHALLGLQERYVVGASARIKWHGTLVTTSGEKRGQAQRFQRT